MHYYPDSLNRITYASPLSFTEPELRGFAPRLRDTDRMASPDDSLKTRDTSILKIPRPKTGSDSVSAQGGDKSSRRVFKKSPKGSVSLGFDYGFLPYTVNMQSPASAFRTEGRVELDLFQLPLDVTYFYSTQKNLIGLNNYFRISFNAQRYKENLNHRLAKDIDSYKGQLGELTSRRQEVVQRMAYLDYLTSVNPDKWPLASRPRVPVVVSDTAINLSGLVPSAQQPIPDTSLIRTMLKDSLQTRRYSSAADSLAHLAAAFKHKKDSVSDLYDKYQARYHLISDSIRQVQHKIAQFEAVRNQVPAYSERSPYLNRIQNFLSGVKKLDIGLCYPGYSSFLVNNIPVRGIDFEYQKNHRFFAFTYGSTVSTLLYNPRNIDGFLQNVRNSYNYFDFNNVSSGRKILSVKFGIGEKNGDHAFAGFLLGKGADYYFTGEPDDVRIRGMESNLVLEADLRKKLSKNTLLDLIIGKSSLQAENLQLSTVNGAVNEIFSNFRSYAALTRLTTRIAATRSDLSFSVRWIDPFFNSFGTGFIRSDNLRYEVKIDQPLGKRIRYSAAARYEEDNLLRLLNYKNTFYSINNTLSYKFRKSLVIRGGYTPLFRELNGTGHQLSTRSVIWTGIVTFNPKGLNVQKQFSFLYNNYRISTDSVPINFENFAYHHQFSFKGGFRTGLNVSWFRDNLSDSSGHSIYLAVLDAGYQFKNGSSFSVAGKSAYKLKQGFHPGFVIKANIRVSKKLFWENLAEKFIIGDLFNGYDLHNLEKFPYCFTTKLILTL
jgi:hypothetical protein